MGIVKIVEREKLRFSAPNLGDARTFEDFEEVRPSSRLFDSAQRTADLALAFVDEKYLPASLRIVLETSGEMTFVDGQKEKIPLSLITSQQQPNRSEIRMGMFELADDAIAFESILAHELGHMLVEWPCRSVGITSPDDFVLKHWEKPIYEGVADWFAAVLTGKTVVGSRNIWFSRDILRFSTLLEARAAPKMLLVDLERGLCSLQLIEKYRAYSEWMELVRKYIADINDPYAEGTWIAGQLWKKSDGERNARALADRIVNLAISGQKMTDPNDFLSRL